MNRRWVRRSLFAGRTIRVGIIVAGSIAAVVLTSPAAAQAGIYKIWNCNPPGHLGQPIGSWHFELPAGVASFDDCSSGGSFGLHTPGASFAYPNTTSSVRLSRPSWAGEIGVVRLKAWFSAILIGSGSPAYVESGTNSLFGPPGRDYTVTPWTGPVLANDNESVDLRLFCSTAASTNCYFNQPPLMITGTEVDLYEAVPPQVEAVGGTLLGSGPQRDTRSLSFAATDGESGIARVEARLDGALVAARDFTTDAQHCRFADFRACSPTESGDLQIDTRPLSDGRYTLALRALDAAGNLTVTEVASPVEIKNAIDAPAGDSLVPVVPGPVTSTPAVGSPASTTAVPVRLTARAGAQRTVRIAYGKRVVVRGKLTDEAGKPIAGSDLRVLTRDRTATAALTDRGTVRTRDDGTFVYITPIGPSRLIRFSYHAVEGSREYSATTDVTLLVRAAAKLRATPRVLRNGSSVRFTGRLRGAPYPATGKLVDLQAKVGRAWRTFQVVRARGDGRFSSQYRFTRTYQALTYRFRARIRVESDYPYQTGSSNQVRVKVRP